MKTKKPKIRFFHGKKTDPRIVEKDRKNRDRIVRSGNSNSLRNGKYQMQVPNVKFLSSQGTINLLDQMDNESVWEASYWAFRNKLMPCMTMNSPIEKLLKPYQIQVSNFSYIKQNQWYWYLILNYYKSIGLISTLKQKRS